MARGLVTDRRVVNRIEELATLNLSGAEIHRRLKAESATFPVNSIPEVRTVQNIANKHRPTSDDNEYWRLTQADPEEIRLVAGVLAFVADISDGVRLFLTKDEATMVVRVRAAFAFNDSMDWQWYVRRVWHLVRTYLRSSAQSLDTKWIDTGVSILAMWSIGRLEADRAAVLLAGLHAETPTGFEYTFTDEGMFADLDHLSKN